MRYIWATAAGLVMAVSVLGQQPDVKTRRSSEPLACFVAQVKWIEIIGKREGWAVPIGTLDLNWIVGVEILSIEKGFKPFEKKGEEILLIHSPALLFRRPNKEILGKQYLFRVFGEVKDGIPHYKYAEVEKRIAPKSARKQHGEGRKRGKKGA